MTDLEHYLNLQRAAVEHYNASENKEGIAVQGQLVEELFGLGLNALLAQPKLHAFLQDVVNQLVDRLRWDGLYDQAIGFQQRLEEFFPESVDVVRLGKANLLVESGQEQAGLAQMHQLLERDPENFWILTNLGAAHLWLNQFDQAEQVFKQAATLTTVRKVDRAIAQKYLFDLYSLQEGRADEAETAWREGCRLDSKMRGLLPQVIRQMVYWREYKRAYQLLSHEKDRVRKLFYQGLIIEEQGNTKEASGYWRSILLDIPFADLKTGQDEYAEACIRLVNPTMAVMILEPLVEANQVNYFRLVILGLAWAQKVAGNRAAWYLNHALRLGDLERPRKTRPAPQGRILDIHSRLLYYDIIVNAPVRAEIDHFFIPNKTASDTGG